MRAHLDLARAEFSEIADEVKRVVGLLGLAFALVLWAFLVLAIGLPLFLGEWLFGSMAWGILHALLVLTGLALVAVATAFGASRRAVWIPVLIGLLVAIGLGISLALDLAYVGAGDAADFAASEFGIIPPRGWERVAVGAVAGALIGGFVLVVAGAVGRRSIRGAAGSLWVGLILGAVLGAVFGSTSFGAQVGTALGITIGLLVWIAGTGTAAASADVTARFAGLTPTTTIETAKETWEWVRARIKLASR